MLCYHHALKKIFSHLAPDRPDNCIYLLAASRIRRDNSRLAVLLVWIRSKRVDRYQRSQRLSTTSIHGPWCSYGWMDYTYDPNCHRSTKGRKPVGLDLPRALVGTMVCARQWHVVGAWIYKSRNLQYSICDRIGSAPVSTQTQKVNINAH